MQEQHVRKPILNFFIKKDLQIRLIKKIVVAVLCATIVSVATLLATYLVKYKSTVIYQVTFEKSDAVGSGEGGATISDREKITSLVFPSLIISGVINIVIAFFIGLYASRKYAVPVFKLEQWANLLNQGQMSAQLHFREKEELKELCDSCNKLANEIRTKFNQIEKLTKELKELEKKPDIVKKIQAILDTVEFKAEAIEVHTSYISRNHLPKTDDSDTRR